MLSVTPNVRFVGVEDDNLDLFEGQYPLQKGISYNSYVRKHGNRLCFGKIVVILTICLLGEKS